MPPSSGELWGRHLMPAIQDVDFLMPNGLLLSLPVSRSATLEVIKFDVWNRAKTQPLFYVLKSPSSYVLVSVTQDARSEEFHDETRRLCDLKLFMPFFKLIEPTGNREEEVLNAKLSNVLGMSVNEFNDVKNLEVVTFRRNVIEHCKSVIELCEKESDDLRAVFRHPPDVHSDKTLPLHLQQLLRKDENYILIQVWTNHSEENRRSTMIKIAHNKYPSDVINAAVTAFQKKMTTGIESNSVLKVCGKREYLLGNYQLDQYKHIRWCIARRCKPSLVLIPNSVLFSNLPKIIVTLPSYVKRGIKALQDITSRSSISTWSIDRTLRIKINVATNVNVRDKGRLYVHTGIYQGTEPLCAHRDTTEVLSSNPSWAEWLEFDLTLMNIPRSARLCLSLCAFNKKQTKKLPYALAWGNINVFDFNARLVSEKMSLQLWPMPAGMEDLLYPNGIPGSCPDSDSACVEVEFDHFSQSVLFPSSRLIEEYAKTLNPTRILHLPAADKEPLEEILARDPLSEILEQDKELLWKLRYVCQRSFPDALPKLLQAVKWNNRDEVAELYSLLHGWPCIKPEIALELLYCTYTDLRVRKFAVSCLEQGLTDDKLAQYLLQLVQVLEFEPYLENALTFFLLKRALMNRRIGHMLFWYLRAEIHKSSIRLRFGLILESYCRTCTDHVKSLNKQVLATEKLTNLCDLLKSENYEQQVLKLGEHLRKSDFQSALNDFESPLFHGQILGSLDVEKCDVKSSKKRPLFLTWKNQEQASDGPLDYQILFKTGDDLRQDMLTLQVIGIMDAIWQKEGLDLRMIPYGCLAMGLNIGMIEIVRNATTVMNILKKDIKTNKTLHSWIKDNAESYAEAVDTFTRSCAGYCVATFVLGIGDRHPSNIMVTRSGQVFHIDFGHFLDHRKKKFGINRERVPFVLTEDFIHVIAKGSDAPIKSKEFNDFMEMCGQAYLALRRHANVFITLFTLMLSCGIPELQSVDDIGYLRKTLKVDCRSEREALEYFQAQFSDAYGGAWTTKLDWFFHYMKHRS